MTDELPLDDQEPDAPRVMLVRVADERLAVPLGDLREVLRDRPATRVAGTPEWVRGLTTVRGALVPVADLVRRGGGTGDAPWLVVVEQGSRQAALGVTAVEGVWSVAESVESPVDSAPAAGATLPRRGAVRLQSQGSAGATGAPDAADVLDVLDVAALLEELFEGD